MLKKLSFSLLLLLYIGISFAQEKNPLLSKLHINDTTRHICDEWLLKHYKKGKLFVNQKEIELYHIYYFTYRREITKESVNNLSLVDSLEPVYLKHINGKRRIFRTYESYVTNSNGKIIYQLFTGVNGSNVEHYVLRSDSLLINLIKTGMTIFHIAKADAFATSLGGPYLGLLGNQIYGIKLTLDGIKIFDKNELMNNHWDEFFEEKFGADGK